MVFEAQDDLFSQELADGIEERKRDFHKIGIIAL
jgi:hypothetical protein